MSLLAVASAPWWKASAPYHMNLSIEMLGSPHNVATGFPQQNQLNIKSKALATMSFMT